MNLIKHFQFIRDLPYNIPLSKTEEDMSCSGKVMRLKKVLENAGYESRYRICNFKWSDLPLPEAILSIPHEDASTHVYLEVKKDDAWLSVDPTWDSGLKHILPVSNWDGTSSTPIAVTPLHLYSIKESHDIMTKPNPDAEKDDMEKNKQFYRALNEWLEEERKS